MWKLLFHQDSCFGLYLPLAPLCHGDVPTLSLYIPILMSTACVTSTWILRPNILATGFPELFISIPSPPLPTSVVCFHCQPLDLVITQKSSSTCKIKNSDTSHIFFQVVHSVISMKQLLEFIWPNSQYLTCQCPAFTAFLVLEYIIFNILLFQPLSAVSSIPLSHYPFITPNWTWSSESNYWPTLLSVTAEKAPRQFCHYVFMVRILNRIRSTAKEFYWMLSFSLLFAMVGIPYFLHCPQSSNFFASLNTQSRWHQLRRHREDRGPRRGQPSTCHHRICKPVHLRSHSSISQPAATEERPFFLTKACPSTTPLPAVSGRDLALWIIFSPVSSIFCSTLALSHQLLHVLKTFSSLKPANKPEMRVCFSPFHRWENGGSWRLRRKGLNKVQTQDITAIVPSAFRYGAMVRSIAAASA